MCGIFGYVGFKNKGQEVVLQGLKDLEYRGYDSWGIAVNSNQKWWIEKQVGKIGKVGASHMPSSQYVLGHTRWATHGGVTKANAHPHTDCSGQIILIHNGIVENYQSLKSNLLKLGHRFKSQTDSEVIAHLIEEFSKTLSLEDAAFKAFNKLKGMSAIIVADQKSKQFIAVKKGSPLVVGYSKHQNFIASDAAALIPHTNQVYYLKNNEAAIITDQRISIKNAITQKPINITPQTIKWKPAQVSKGSYPHYMLKEIHEQPEVMTKILDSKALIQPAAALIARSKSLYAIGCGTASHACIAGSYIFSQYANTKLNWRIASELKYTCNLIDKKSVVMGLSQSGETMDTLEAIDEAKQRGAKIIALVNVVGSSLDRESDISIPLLAGPEKAVASTKAFIAKLTYLFLLADPKSLSDSAKIEESIAAIRHTLTKSYQAKLIKLAKNLAKSHTIFVTGRGISYPVALEIALKIKEISYIHAEGLAAGELKHGVIALIEKGTPCLVCAPQDQAFAENITAAMELKARGAYIIGISPSNHEVFDVHLKTKDLGLETAFQNTVIGQLLAYYLAVEKNIDPDMPRNLAKSVTVK